MARAQHGRYLRWLRNARMHACTHACTQQAHITARARSPKCVTPISDAAQIGFAMYEVGSVRVFHIQSILIKVRRLQRSAVLAQLSGRSRTICFYLTCRPVSRLFAIDF